jgi:hypothetical protein
MIGVTPTSSQISAPDWLVGDFRAHRPPLRHGLPDALST